MEKFKAYQHIFNAGKAEKARRRLLILLPIVILFLFLPWTQNIRAKGSVTTLKLEQRPQQINTVIGGTVVKWFVKEGDRVRKGDTIVQLAEIKTDYLDPQLLERTQEQLNAKQRSAALYNEKANANAAQITALDQSLNAKLLQLQNKIMQLEVKAEADSSEMLAATNDLRITTLQFERQKQMYDSGLVSLTQFELRNQAFQQAKAKKIAAENKFSAAKQEIRIARTEFNALRQDYAEKTAKVTSDKLSSLSMAAGAEAESAKLLNQLSSYSIRNGMYYILAPQDGQVVKARAAGIGEIVKEGEMLLSIVPSDIDFAVEMYVRPADLPLLNSGQRVRFIFDGFPAIVFSGWPSASFGSFEGIITAVENDVSNNGQFRVLVKEDPHFKPWPATLKMGTGANGIALLKNVPIWYELWRNINSFPPDYYQPQKTERK